MDPVEEQLRRLRQNPANWEARAELARLWRERGVEFGDDELLSGAVGAPRNRRELEVLIDGLGGPPFGPRWVSIFDEYLRWAPGCALGFVALAHATESAGNEEEALSLFQTGTGIDPSLAEPPLRCLMPEPERPVPMKPEEEKGKLTEDSRFVSLMVALGVHLILILFLSFYVIYSPPSGPPQITAVAPPDDASITPTTAEKKSAVSPISNTNPLSIDAAPNMSDMAVSMKSPTVGEAPDLMAGMGFSPSMSFGEQSGGSVSFFGSQGKTQKMVYVVDVSGSMQNKGKEGKSRIELLKEELARSVSALPLSVKYQIIFFSNKAWFAGDEADSTGLLFGGADDPENYTSRPLLRATPSQKRKTLEHIEGIRSGGGTNWRLPLKMAMKLQPDLIYFMTDGEFDNEAGKIPVIDDVVAYNRTKSNAKVNAICLIEIKAYDKLQDLASRTRGNVFLVQEDGKILRGLALEQALREAERK